MSRCYDNPEYDDLGNGLQNTWEQFQPKQSTKDRILSETSKETKQRVRDTANRLVMKQETLEEAAERRFPSKMEMYDVFIEGAKWQQERSYSEEEVIDILLLSYSSISDRSLAGADLRKWFEQFKKK
jgi:hypothetical protein